MKFTRSLMTAALAAAVTASPIATPNSIVIDMDEQELSRIQETDAELRATVGTTANEFTSGGCRDVVLVYARGTGQDGNMVSFMRSNPPSTGSSTHISNDTKLI